MKKFYSEVTLVNQAFVINPDVTVGQAAKDAGAEILDFVRLEVGEGIEFVRNQGRQGRRHGRLHTRLLGTRGARSQ